MKSKRRNSSAYLLSFLIALFSPFLLVAEEQLTVTEGRETVTEQAQEPLKETVVLLQGMGRGRASLWVLDTRLRKEGFNTVTFPYIARNDSIDELASQLCSFLETELHGAPYHLIAHSLGNIIIRAAFREGLPEGLKRIVMLAPPNQPADLVRALRENKIYQWFTGESGQQLASEEFYSQLPIPDVAFGIIAGTQGQDLRLDEPNDGVIRCEQTKLEGMTDWIAVEQSHNFIMNSKIVASLCVSFLEQGRFDRAILESAED
ncbi:MAG: hypothetical protein GX117_13930 [Candidatus Hydrogenedentes bacterium]|jgi:triacylglycerol lipase|nr:hypothetical protein [Candidatus Hydrogenedentota bacterium]